MKQPISHVLKPGPIDAMTTKCGVSLSSRRLKNHTLAMNPAAATCVPCAAVVAAELEVTQMRRGNTRADLQKYYDWADGPDSGVSSKTIVQALTGASVLGTWNSGTPRDPSDFGRCYRVMKLFPELREQLDVLANAQPEWRALVNCWSELEALYEEELPQGKAPKLYARMKELRGE